MWSWSEPSALGAVRSRVLRVVLIASTSLWPGASGVTRGDSGIAVQDTAIHAVPSDRDSSSILVDEHFDDADLAARGWYDMTNPEITTDEHIPGSLGSLRLHFKRRARNPEGRPGRHLFEATEVVVLSFWVKYSANWVGSTVHVHPHEFYLLTNKDPHPFVGPVRSPLAVYIEHNYKRRSGLVPMVGARGRRMWGSERLTNSRGRRYKNDWHFIEVLVRMNSAPGEPDGTVQYWMDGELIIDEHDVVFRSREGEEDMLFNQLLIGPYIGRTGSPVNQTMWLDNLSISTARVGS